MTTRITVDQLERMKVHDLADLLTNVVLLLKRMPNVECRELLQNIADDIHFSQVQSIEQPTPVKAWTEEELKEKTVLALKKIANDLHLSYPAKIKKDELVAKILARSASGRSEQYAIQEL